VIPHIATDVTTRGLSVCLQGGPKKTGPLLNVDNFAMVSGRKACDMSKVYKIFLEKKCKLA